VEHSRVMDIVFVDITTRDCVVAVPLGVSARDATGCFLCRRLGQSPHFLSCTDLASAELR
jgi:hypothetical protein